jgi:DNA-binding CsgD family transcriptional regulator
MSAAVADCILERALSDGPENAGVPCRFRDGSLLAIAGEELEVSDAEYRSAVDRRRVRVVRRISTPNFAQAVVWLEGRQVGSLGCIVPTGRAFSSFAHVIVTLERGAAVGLIVESGLIGALTGASVGVVASSAERGASVIRTRPSERADLLNGDAVDTFWAKAWNLPPRLARLAVLLMAGLPLESIRVRTELSLRTVRTYTEALFARAGVHSRSELALAALRAGRAPG